MHAGVPLVDALAIVSNLSGNVLIGEGIRAACGTLEKGQSLAAHFRSQDWCPPMLTQMMAVGEQSGALDELLAKAAEHLERELEAKIMGLTAGFSGKRPCRPGLTLRPTAAASCAGAGRWPIKSLENI